MAVLDMLVVFGGIFGVGGVIVFLLMKNQDKVKKLTDKL